MSVPNPPSGNDANKANVEPHGFANPRTEVFAEYSIGLPERLETALELPPSELVLRPSRFQPEHTFIAAIESLGGEDTPPDPMTTDPAFGESSGR